MNKKNRVMTLTAVIITMFSICGVTTYARDNDGYSVDFNTASGWSANDGFENGQAYNGWTFTKDKNYLPNSTIKIVSQGNGDNYLNITTVSNHSGWPTVKYTFPVTMQRFSELEFKVYFAEGHQNGFTVQTLFNDKNDSNNDNWTDLATIYKDYVNEKVSGSNGKIIDSMPTGRYYRFNIRYDNQTKKVYFFRDGNQVSVITPILKELEKEHII